MEVNVAVSPLLPVDDHHPPLEASMPVVKETGHTFVDNHPRSLNYRKINFSAFLEHFATFDWNHIFEGLDVDGMTSTFCDVINRWLQANVPLRKQPVSPAWSTPLLCRLKQNKNTCQQRYRDHRNHFTKQSFKHASKRYRWLNSRLYKSHVLRVQTNLRRNPKGFWSFVNSKRKTASIPTNVFFNDTVSSNMEDSCQLFADHFASVFATNHATAEEAELAAGAVPQDAMDLNLPEVSRSMILEAARKLKSSYSPGPDGIPAVLYCRGIDAMINPLSQIFNNSLQQAKFPTIWKSSVMFPVFKSGDKHSVKNYRGITSLSAGSKLFEIVVNKALLDAAKGYISADQHGFVPGRSVVTNLLSFTSSCINNLERKLQVDAVYTDLKAAFDRIDHNILLAKLKRLGATERLTYVHTSLTEFLA